MSDLTSAFTGFGLCAGAGLICVVILFLVRLIHRVNPGVPGIPVDTTFHSLACRLSPTITHTGEVVGHFQGKPVFNTVMDDDGATYRLDRYVHGPRSRSGAYTVQLAGDELLLSGGVVYKRC